MADVKFATLSGGCTVVSRARGEDFQGSLYGASLLPGGQGYDSVRRVWNAIDSTTVRTHCHLTRVRGDPRVRLWGVPEMD